jgi:predicted nucleic acid-binding protein
MAACPALHAACASAASRSLLSIFELKHNFTAYDAMYVALAERLGLPLLTDDAKFAATPGHHAKIQHCPG